MMTCATCDRRTPAARATCMYCGAMLAVTRIEVAPAQRALESFERAFNVVLEPKHARKDANTVSRFAAALQLETAEAEAFVTADKCVPVARCLSQQESEL